MNLFVFTRESLAASCPMSTRRPQPPWSDSHRTRTSPSTRTTATWNTSLQLVCPISTCWLQCHVTSQRFVEQLKVFRNNFHMTVWSFMLRLIKFHWGSIQLAFRPVTQCFCIHGHTDSHVQTLGQQNHLFISFPSTLSTIITTLNNDTGMCMGLALKQRGGKFQTT